MAQENRTWGYEICAHTVANILKRHGIEPAPERERKTTWKEFLSRHCDQLPRRIFFTVEVWTLKSLQRFMILFFIELSSRRVQLGGIAKWPQRTLASSGPSRKNAWSE
jgi:hypothetical protein